MFLDDVYICRKVDVLRQKTQLYEAMVGRMFMNVYIDLMKDLLLLKPSSRNRIFS
jgi:hypothetical protein